jgi:hypothetical protein
VYAIVLQGQMRLCWYFSRRLNFGALLVQLLRSTRRGSIDAGNAQLRLPSECAVDNEATRGFSHGMACAKAVQRRLTRCDYPPAVRAADVMRTREDTLTPHDRNGM